jgi:2-C-methyl-D-erythritol 4-phosphate cytidylyltransferase/2-C-methyl-D-erythritol 2,4-cyclodiphosphate synthase
MNTLAIVVAAGRGERMGGARPKAFLDLAGEPLLLHSARAFEAAPSVDAIVAVVPGEHTARADALLRPLRKLRGVVAGGERRQDSVWEGLRQAPDGFEGVVLVHDAARPLVEIALIERVAAVARERGAALPVTAVTDTVKRVRDGLVEGTEPRDALVAAQTPQGFLYRVLADAYKAARGDGVVVTDEAMAVERAGRAVAVVEGSPVNRKITRPEDLEWAEAALAGGRARASSLIRVGTGFDVHRLEPGRPLRLGTVDVPHDKGLQGHSDGDCLAHAVCDALLGAAGLGDMGLLFPSADDRWRAASGHVFLEEVRRRLHGAGLRALNVDATVIAEAPRLGPHAAAMAAALAEALGLAASAVSVKIKSADGLGTIGRGEGIAAQAVALVGVRP